MIFMYLLASALTAWTSVLGRSAVPGEAVYKELEQMFKDKNIKKVEGVNDNFDRLVNLKYVTVIRNSSIWPDVKRRLLTTSTTHHWTVEILNAEPESLSDPELVTLRRACHDGLKCVAVDHLSELRLLTKSRRRGAGLDTSVHQAIADITRVLTRYTTKCVTRYELDDEYQYMEVTESDDPSKVRRLMTVIIRDNVKLCKPRNSRKSYAKTGFTGGVRGNAKRVKKTNSFKKFGGSVRNKGPSTNDGTIKNHDHKGKNNSAKINSLTQDSVVHSVAYERKVLAAKDQSPHGHKDAANIRRDDNLSGDHGTSDDHSESSDDSSSAVPEVPSPVGGFGRVSEIAGAVSSGGHSHISKTPEATAILKTDKTTPDVASTHVGSSASMLSHKSDSRNTANDNDNYTNFANGSGGVEKCINDGKDSREDIRNMVMANSNVVRGEFLDDSDEKNSNKNTQEANNGIVNKLKATSGIINVGTLNNGSINKESKNNVTTQFETVNSFDAQQLAINIDKEFPMILSGFAG